MQSATLQMNWLGPSLSLAQEEVTSVQRCVMCVRRSVTLCDPRDRSPPGSSVYGDSPRRNTGVGCHSLVQGIFPTQRSNLGLLHYRQILYGQTERKPLPSEENPTNHFNQLSFLSCVSLKSFSLNRVRMINIPST